MAKVLGEAGRYTTNKAQEDKRKKIFLSLILMAIIGLIEGLLISSMFVFKNYWLLAMAILIAISGYFVIKSIDKKVEELEKEIINYLKGTYGENSIAKVLDKLSDDYTVINGLSTDAGDIDHVVVGPTGIYLIDTKNWNGVVSADGKGGLLLNGKQTNKQEIRNFQIRVMEIRKRFLSLCNIDDVYFQPLFVFPSARVDAQWGTTRHVYCMSDEQLLKYITDEKKTKKRIPKDLIEKYKKGFTAMARMDESF